MKKVWKKAPALLLALLLALSMCLPAMAKSNDGKITIKGNEKQTLIGKEFTYHQLLTVNVTGEGDDKNVLYAVNEAYKNLLAEAMGKSAGDKNEVIIGALKDTLKEESRARQFAETMREKILAADIKGTVVTATEENVTDNKLTIDGLAYGYYLVLESGTQDGATSLCMLDTAAPEADIKIKSDYPAVEKKVKEDVSYTDDAGYGNGYNDAADYDIGDDVPFSFYTTVPDMTGYQKYSLVFHDSMSKGLTFNNDLSVSINGEKLQSGNFTVSTSNLPANETFSVTIANVLAIAKKGDVIRVDYTAKLNENAVVGRAGNPNEVYLEYSANPYKEEDTRKTPEDKVIVFTFASEINKVETGTETRLAGAEFTLFSDKETTKQINVSKVAGKVAEYVVDPAGTDVITTVASENIVVYGLDSGTYYLKEIKAPAGYNLLKKPVELTIQATYLADRQKWESGDAADALVALTAENAQMTEQDRALVKVENSTGVLLPGTGGIGTVVFTVSGMMLMAGAGFMLIKMRAKNAQEEK